VLSIGSHRSSLRPATANARRPYVLRLCRGTTRWWCRAERSCRLIYTQELVILCTWDSELRCRHVTWYWQYPAIQTTNFGKWGASFHIYQWRWEAADELTVNDWVLASPDEYIPLRHVRSLMPWFCMWLKTAKILSSSITSCTLSIIFILIQIWLSGGIGPIIITLLLLLDVCKSSYS